MSVCRNVDSAPKRANLTFNCVHSNDPKESTMARSQPCPPSSVAQTWNLRVLLLHSFSKSRLAAFCFAISVLSWNILFAAPSLISSANGSCWPSASRGSGVQSAASLLDRTPVNAFCRGATGGRRSAKKCHRWYPSGTIPAVAGFLVSRGLAVSLVQQMRSVLSPTYCRLRRCFPPISRFRDPSHCRASSSSLQAPTSSQDFAFKRYISRGGPSGIYVCRTGREAPSLVFRHSNLSFRQPISQYYHHGLAAADGEEALTVSPHSQHVTPLTGELPGRGGANEVPDGKYVPAYPFRNHVLFDEPVFAAMNQIRHLIHKLELSSNKDISPKDIDEKLLPLLCEGDLLERTLELARSNYRQQVATAASGDTEWVSTVLAEGCSSERKAVGGDGNEADIHMARTGLRLDQGVADAYLDNAESHFKRRDEDSESATSGSDANESNGENSDRESLDPLSRLRRLEHIAPQLLALARYHRRRQAKRKVERLLAAMLGGDAARIDALFLQMAEQKLLDAHLLNFLDEMIHEAHMKYSAYKAKEALSETALKLLKRRILAHLEMMKTNRQDFVRILSLCLQTQTEKRRAILKASLYTVEDLERFQEWLEDGIQFGEETGKLKKDQLKVMRHLVEDCKQANPLNKATLDHWQEENSFQSDLNLQAAWDMSDGSANSPGNPRLPWE